MRIAACQLAAGVSPAENLAVVAGQITEAAAGGADVVVFPEAAMARFGIPLGPVAEPLDGPWATRVRALADSAGVLVVAGMFTPGSSTHTGPPAEGVGAGG
ncbi:nitrilase-related carbon-nitrogen hydrolase, partial [Streptomyces specialis]|uniref:nitrilase-related carbon-nitrogen hydrolase n=1 Tax=Streptomyces specialis TaxID=498367 RepID=UPI002D21AC34